MLSPFTAVILSLLLSPARSFLLPTPARLNPIHHATAQATTHHLSNAPIPKYPTLRGETVDPRAIKSSELLAIRLSHALFATELFAKEALKRWTSLDETDAPELGVFASFCENVSLCDTTRAEGGIIGWVDAVADAKNEHLDLILPPIAREAVLKKNAKPGDVVLVSSDRGFHLIQVDDVMVDVKAAATWRRKRSVRLQGSDQGSAAKMNDGSVSYYKMETMGCQMNQADSERMEGQLQLMGYLPQPEGSLENPKLVVLNTCSIREHAEAKVYSHIGPHAKRKREGEDVTIVVAGCVAQQEGRRLLRRAPEVDLVMGPQFANRMADLLEDVEAGNQVVATEATHVMEDATKPRRGSKVCAWVNVIYGCNERCTYCVVPTTRGVEQSRPIGSILKEINELVEEGYREVTLLGQNIDAYGRDMKPKRKFADLLRLAGNVEGLDRLRFVTSHPKYMNEDVVDAVAETKAACQNFHVPFQAGSDEVLHRMGRGYTIAKYMKIINRIKEKCPDASITADVIVGFPEETEEQFLETLALMEAIVFDSVNTAAYSPRPNTPAANWENQVPEDVKDDRLRRINELNLKHAYIRRQRMQGRVVEVLVEERNLKRTSQVMGRTEHGYLVYFDGEIDDLRGEFVMVKIDKCATYHLIGSPVNPWVRELHP